MSGPKIVAILQPVYLPWLGYFEQMAVADHFVFLDDVQYTRHDWRNRNRVKTATGPIWLTVPVRKHRRDSPIHDIEINNREDWRRRHLRSIEVNYSKCPYFQPLYSELERELSVSRSRLVDLDTSLISLLCRHLAITTPTSLASAIAKTAPSAGDPNRRILEICRHHEAEILYDGARAARFIDVERFRDAGIEVVFQDYRHPRYRQAFGEFLSHQAAIDLIMNTGPEAPAILRSSPLPRLLRRG